MKREHFLFIFLLILVILIVGFFFSRKSQAPKTSLPGPLPKEQTIILNKNGFSPKSITISSKTSVRWVNNLSEHATVNSDNYPTNRLHKEINLGIFENGSTLTHIFTQPGSYGYHDQFHPNFKGTIVVEK
jgi:plastocyanin